MLVVITLMQAVTVVVLLLVIVVAAIKTPFSDNLIHNITDVMLTKLLFNGDYDQIISMQVAGRRVYTGC